jgi:AraC-like DNA-binding protein
VIFHHRRPAPPLDRWVEMVWIYEDRERPAGLERVLPTGAAQLILNLAEDVTRIYDPDRAFRCVESAGSILTGPGSRHQVIDTAEQQFVAGAVFRAGGVAAFTRLPVHETLDLDVALDDLWGGCAGSTLRARVLEAPDVDGKLDVIESALREMRQPREPHPAVAFALDTFRRSPRLTSITKVTDATGLSAKRFIDRFKREVGLTPKRYCRVLRFQRALRQAHGRRAIDWAHVAVDCGYFDQAHLIHDFRSFSGLTPSAYEGGRTLFQNHVTIDG